MSGRDYAMFLTYLLAPDRDMPRRVRAPPPADRRCPRRAGSTALSPAEAFLRQPVLPDRGKLKCGWRKVCCSSPM